MSSDQSGRRSPRRIALEVVGLGVLVLLAVVVMRASDGAPGDAPAAVETVSEPGIVEITTAPASRPIPSDPNAWNAMSHDDLERVGRRVAETTRGFRFDRVEVFSGAGLTNAIAVLVHEKTGLEFSLIPPGSFLMGSPGTEVGRLESESPVHRVTLRHPLLICRTECAVIGWYRGLQAALDWDPRDANLPIFGVSWSEVAAWSESQGLRLPSESEWEYACRAGTESAYWAGDGDAGVARVGWYLANAESEVHPVGEKVASPFGLHDVHGNVWEWCADSWHANYEEAPQDGSPWVEERSRARVARGGGFVGPSRDARSACRSEFDREVADRGIGFRPAATVGTD